MVVQVQTQNSEGLAGEGRRARACTRTGLPGSVVSMELHPHLPWPGLPLFFFPLSPYFTDIYSKKEGTEILELKQQQPQPG